MIFGDRVRKAQHFNFDDNIVLCVDPLTGELIAIGGRHLESCLDGEDLEAIRNFCLAVTPGNDRVV